MIGSRIAALLLVGSFTAAASAAVTTEVVDLPSRGATQRILYLKPDAPVANIVFLSGGTGSLGIRPDGTMTSVQATCGPIPRYRQAYAESGVAVALVDATSDGDVWDPRDTLTVIRYVQGRANVPTWVVGISGSGPGVVASALTLPSDVTAGYFALNPDAIAREDANAVKRPTMVVVHGQDANGGAAFYINLTQAPVKEFVVLNGGSTGCNNLGHHVFAGQDEELLATIRGLMDKYAAALAAPTTVPAVNYEGLFYNAPAESEAGWGINFEHQGDVIFATWFTYDLTGKPWWLTMTADKIAEGRYSGTIMQTRGPAFNSVPFNPGAVTASAVGTGTVTFTDVDNGSFSYVVNGVSQVKPLTRQIFSVVPTCVFGAQATLALATNYQGLWYAAPAESEAGWGVNFTHQGEIIFATWFTYDGDGTPLWLSATVNKTADGVYTGTLYRTSGPAFNAVPFLPTNVKLSNVGTLTVTFADGNSGSFAYTVNLGGPGGAVTQTKSIVRQVFRTPGTLCH